MSEPAPVSEKEAGTAPGDPTPAAPPAGDKKKREYKDFGHEQEKATRSLSAHPSIPLSCTNLALPIDAKVDMNTVSPTPWFSAYSALRTPFSLDRAQGRGPLR